MIGLYAMTPTPPRFIPTQFPCIVSICGTRFVRLGDMQSRLFIPMILVYILKKKLGVIPDFEEELESTSNTALQYHAGSAMLTAYERSKVLMLCLPQRGI